MVKVYNTTDNQSFLYDIWILLDVKYSYHKNYVNNLTFITTQLLLNAQGVVINI